MKIKFRGYILLNSKARYFNCQMGYDVMWGGNYVMIKKTVTILYPPSWISSFLQNTRKP